jgi:RNA polymerase sigma factor (sigma-70 family)
LSLSEPLYGVNNVNAYSESIDAPSAGGPSISAEVIKALRTELFRRAAARAPSMLDPIEFGKDMAQKVLLEAWQWFIEGDNQTKEDLERMANHVLNNRLNDEYRKTENRGLSESLEVLYADASADSLLALTGCDPLPDELLNRADIVNLVARALAKLTDPDECKILELRFWSGKTNSEIADELGISERTVIRKYLRAKETLKRALCVLIDVNL